MLLHLPLVLAQSLLLSVVNIPLKKSSSVAGFSLVTLCVLLSLTTSASIYLYKKFVYYSEISDNRSVVKYIDRLLPILNTYYTTECYANNGLVAASLSLDDLKTAGYIPDNYPSPIKGNLELQIDKSTQFTRLIAVIKFLSSRDARKISNIQGVFTSTLSNNEVTWVSSTSAFRREFIDNDVDINVFSNNTGCL